MIKTMYGLFNKKHRKLMQFTAVGEDGFDNPTGRVEYSLDVIGDYEIGLGSETFWLVGSRDIAERVAKSEGSMLSTDYEAPYNRFVEDGLEVVQVKLTVTLPASCLYDLES